MTTKIEARLYDDMDEIGELSEQALLHLRHGDDLDAEEKLDRINDIAASWGYKEQ